MSHWAARYIGKPWAPDADGPARYSCWGLVRAAFRERHGVDMPPVRVGQAAQSDANVAAIKQASLASGWRLAAAPAQEDDIVLMRNLAGHRHVGLIVRANGTLGVLHADGHLTPGGPIGQVVWQPIAEATAGGYHDHEFWRRA